MSKGIPLEQGLRHLEGNPGVGILLSKGIPLEQGLRLHNKIIYKLNIKVKGHSIRTRIKTLVL